MLNTEKVKEIMRIRGGMNISQLSKKIGISSQHLSNILGSTRGLSVETLKALAQALDVDVADILDDSLKNESQPTISAKGDGITVEKNSRLRVTLPLSENSYELIKQLITENDELDNKIQELLLKADEKVKEKILDLLQKGQENMG